MRHTVCNTQSPPEISWWEIQSRCNTKSPPKMSWSLMRHTVCNTKSHPKMSWWDIQYAIPNLIPRCPDETYSMQYQISILMRHTVVLMRHTVCNTKSHPKMSWWDIQYAIPNLIPRCPDETYSMHYQISSWPSCPDERYSMQYQISSQDVLMRHTVCNTKSHPKMSWWDIQYAIPNLIPRCPDETYSMQH